MPGKPGVAVAGTPRAAVVPDPGWNESPDPNFELELALAQIGAPVTGNELGCLTTHNISDVNGTLFDISPCAPFNDPAQIFNLG